MKGSVKRVVLFSKTKKEGMILGGFLVLTYLIVEDFDQITSFLNTIF